MPEPATPGAGGADEDNLAFPRGLSAGDCLHAAFEQIAFDDPASWPGAIDAALRTRLPRTLQAGLTALLPKMVTYTLGDVLHTPLPGAAPPVTLKREVRLNAHGRSEGNGEGGQTWLCSR